MEVHIFYFLPRLDFLVGIVIGDLMDAIDNIQRGLHFLFSLHRGQGIIAGVLSH